MTGCLSGGAWALALCLAAAPAAAHPQQPVLVREIVRLQGYLAPPRGQEVPHQMLLAVHGERYRLHVTEFQVLRSAGPGAPQDDAPPAELRLEGDRRLLAGLASISAQRVTLFGERRPGAAEIFLLALDICPPLEK